jgi:hypothetical protein
MGVGVIAEDIRRAREHVVDTLAHGWRAADLASHVAAQDRTRGVNGPTKPWRRSLEMLAKPPPRAVLAPRIAPPITRSELFVHHEDVRRPAGVPRDAAPTLDPAPEWVVRDNRRALNRPLRIDTGEALRQIGDDGRPTTVRGTIADVVMWLSGRDAPLVDLDASPSEAESLRARLSIPTC